MSESRVPQKLLMIRISYSFHATEHKDTIEILPKQSVQLLIEICTFYNGHTTVQLISPL